MGNGMRGRLSGVLEQADGERGEGAVWGLPAPQLLPNRVLGFVVLSRSVVSDFL